MSHQSRLILSKSDLTASFIEAITGVASPATGFAAIGDISSSHSRNILTYIKDARYAGAVNANPNIAGIFCTPEVADAIRPDVVKLLCDDPNWAYFTLLDGISKEIVWAPSTVLTDRASLVDVSIDPIGVHIGANVSIGPGVRILTGACIEDNVTIRANAVLGGSGFQHQPTSRGIVSPGHDGILVVESGAEIGPHNFLSTGFSYRNTCVGAHSKLDSHVYLAHGAQIGTSCIVASSCVILGHAVIGNDCRIGPNATITNRVRVGDGATVSIGSVVTRDVGAGQRVTGNFAVDHQTFMRNLKNTARPG